jgi:hypothetical protein
MPVIRKPKRTDAEKVSVTRQITSAMKVTPTWTASPTLQAAATAWNAAADGVESNAKSVKDARAKLAQLEAAQRTARKTWALATRQILSTAAIAAAGSPDTVQALGFDVFTRVVTGLQPAPGGVVSSPGTVTGEAVVSWQKGSARNGFQLQRATDPANPATVSAAIACTKTKYTVEGEKSASTIYFRVAAVDPQSKTGISPWSDWVACTVR